MIKMMKEGPVDFAVKIAAAVVFIVVLAVNSVFTFTYGWAVIGPFLLVDQVGEFTSRAISGVTCVLFYDVAYTTAFILFVSNFRKTIAQYATILISFVVSFLLSITASAVAITLVSPLGAYVPETALLIMRYVGYIALIVGFVVNACSGFAFIAFSPAMMDRLRANLQQAHELAGKIRFEDQLDEKVEQLVEQYQLQNVDAIAKAEADRRTRVRLGRWDFQNGQEPVENPTKPDG